MEAFEGRFNILTLRPSHGLTGVRVARWTEMAVTAGDATLARLASAFLLPVR